MTTGRGRSASSSVGLVRPGRRGEQQHAVVLGPLETKELALHVLLPAGIAEALPQLGRIDRWLHVKHPPDPRMAGERPAQQLVPSAVQAPVIRRPGLEHVVDGPLPLLGQCPSSLAPGGLHLPGPYPNRRSRLTDFQAAPWVTGPERVPFTHDDRSGMGGTAHAGPAPLWRGVTRRPRPLAAGRAGRARLPQSPRRRAAPATVPAGGRRPRLGGAARG